MNQAFAVVEYNDPDIDKKAVSNVTEITIAGEPGVFRIDFHPDAFTGPPAVAVTQAYNGGGHIVTHTGTPGGPLSDNAEIINIDPEGNYVRIKTGSGNVGFYRSFCLIAVGV